MNQLKKRLCAAILGCCLCLPAIAPAQERDIVDTALTVHNFNLFLSLMKDAEIVFDLKGTGPFTIFIPSNEAIEARYTKTQLDALRGNRARLRQILFHHVVRGRIDAVTAAKAGQLHPLMGPVIRTEIVGGRGWIGGGRFWIVNVLGSNGVLHGIDRVLVP